MFDKWALVYQERFMDVSMYGESFADFCERLRKGAAVLELGCGPGNVTRYLLDLRPDLKITGTDMAPKMIELARVNNPQAEFMLLDCRAIDTVAGQDDGVMAGFCLPYLTHAEAAQMVADAARILSARGVLYLSTMEEDDNISKLQTNSMGDQVQMHYYKAEYLQQLMANNGFTDIVVSHKQYAGPGDSVVRDVLLVGQKGG